MNVSHHHPHLQVTARRLWKSVYDDLGGSPGSTSAATCTRRHYERWGLSLTSLSLSVSPPLPHHTHTHTQQN
jgi:hypothetical protein